MSQINMGAMLVNRQVPIADNSGNKVSNNTSKAKENSFSKELDKAKNDQTSNQSTQNVQVKDNEGTAQKTEVTTDASKEKMEANKEVAVAEETVNETLNDEQEEIIDEQALALLSQVLNIPVEQIKQVLQNMQCTPKDLLNPDVFSDFISQVYPGNNLGELLVMEEGLKDIGKLLEKLENLYHGTASLGQSLNQAIVPKETIPGEEITTSNLNDNQKDPVVIMQEVQKVTNQELTTEVATELTTQVVGEQSTKATKVNETNEIQYQATIVQDTSEPDLGLVVPIQNFSSTHLAQMLKPDQPTLASTVNGNQFIQDSLIEQIDFKQLGEVKELHLQLAPKELGRLSIKMIEVNGNLVADIKVESEKTKAFILSEINQLKSSLEEQGLNVSEVKVDIRQDSHQSQMEQERQKSSRRIQEIISKHMQDLDEEEAMEEITPQTVSESEVDYMI